MLLRRRDKAIYRLRSSMKRLKNLKPILVAYEKRSKKRIINVKNRRQIKDKLKKTQRKRKRLEE